MFFTDSYRALRRGERMLHFKNSNPELSEASVRGELI